MRPRDTGERRGVGRCCRVRLLPWEQLSRQPGLPARSFLQQREDRSIYCIIRKSWFWGSAGGGEIKPPAATCHLQGPEQQTRTNLVPGPRARLSPTCVLHQNPAPVDFLQAPKVRARPLSGSLLPPASTRLPRGARLPRISVGLRGFNLITPSLLHAAHPWQRHSSLHHHHLQNHQLMEGHPQRGQEGCFGARSGRIREGNGARLQQPRCW